MNINRYVPFLINTLDTTVRRKRMLTALVVYSVKAAWLM